MTWRTLVQNKLILYFLLIPFFVPYSLKFIPSVARIYALTSFWKLGSVMLIFLLYLMRHKLSVIIFLISTINLILFTSSAFNGLHDINVYTDLLPALALPMLIELGIEANIDEMLHVIFMILATLTFLNFILLIIYPKGLPFASLYTQARNPLYFLGQDNGIVYNLLSLLGINYILAVKNYSILKVNLLLNDKILKITPRIFFFNVICLLTMMIVGSATGTMMVLLFIMMLQFSTFIKRKHNIWPLIAIYFSFFLSVIVFGKSNPLIAEVTNLLGRDAGFTGRSLLWENSLELISQKPLFGWGNNAEIIPIWGNFFSSHNQLLDVAARGGLLALVFFIGLHVYIFLILGKIPSSLANILFVTIFCFLVGGLMEAGVRPTQYIFIALAYYAYVDYKKTRIQA